MLSKFWFHLINAERRQEQKRQEVGKASEVEREERKDNNGEDEGGDTSFKNDTCLK